MANYSEKSRTAYNKKANGYDNSREGQFTNRIHQLLLPMIDWQPGQSVLDVACGTGSLLAAMNDRKQIRGFGIDISERMIEQAMARNPGMAFYISGCDRIPCPNDSMDIITVCAAYHHFPDVAAFAGESARLLKSGGLIYIVDIYVPPFLRVLVNPFVPLLFKDGDVRLYAPKEILRNFARHGFSETDVQTIGTLQFVRMRKS